MGIVDKVKKNADKAGIIIGVLSPPNAVGEMINAVKQILKGNAHLPTEARMMELIDYPEINLAAKAGIGLLVARELGFLTNIVGPGLKLIGGYLVGRVVNHTAYWSVHSPPAGAPANNGFLVNGVGVYST